MSPWRHIPYERLSPELRRALTILNRRWIIVWLLTLALGLMLPLWLNSQRVNQIQTERSNSIVRACQETNQRRDDAFRTLDSLLARALAEQPTQRKRINASRDSTRLLINSLVPFQDCEKRASELVSSK